MIPMLDDFTNWWITQPQLNMYSTDHPIFIAAEMAWNAAKHNSPVATCDVAGRLKFEHPTRGTRYGNCPDWVTPGTKLYK